MKKLLESKACSVSSNKRLISFCYTEIKYMFSEKQKTAPHPFHVKSGNWQPLPHLNNTYKILKLELLTAVFIPQPDNMSANKRTSIRVLKNKKELNLKQSSRQRNNHSHFRHHAKTRGRHTTIIR